MLAQRIVDIYNTKPVSHGNVDYSIYKNYVVIISDKIDPKKLEKEVMSLINQQPSTCYTFCPFVKIEERLDRKIKFTNNYRFRSDIFYVCITEHTWNQTNVIYNDIDNYAYNYQPLLTMSSYYGYLHSAVYRHMFGKYAYSYIWREPEAKLITYDDIESTNMKKIWSNPTGKKKDNYCHKCGIILFSSFYLYQNDEYHVHVCKICIQKFNSDNDNKLYKLESDCKVLSMFDFKYKDILLDYAGDKSKYEYAKYICGTIKVFKK